jgi:imidazolonepropionase
LIDSHTHICYGGSRANDYALKIDGFTYQDILANGGGIYDTVNKTRNASEKTLFNSAMNRVNRLFRSGVTTIEIKSGYGLSLEDEMKMLKVIADLSNHSQPDIIPTCLAAHVKPDEFNTTGEYLNFIASKLLPTIKARNFSNRVDIFIEENAFQPDESLEYLMKAKNLGFDITVHADQFSSGGSSLAVKVNALSADHLEASNENEIEILAKSETVATVLPGASIGLGIPFAQARKLLDAGCCLAIASDYNPGSAPMGDLLLQASLLSIYQKLSFAETYAGISVRAAKALGLNDRGKIATGQIADLVSFPVNDYREILYNQGQLKPSLIWKNGKKYSS